MPHLHDANLMWKRNLKMSGLEIRSVSKTYQNKVRVLENVTLHVEQGEFVVLVGPSGCGKSTLLRLIAGLEEITEGSVWLAGRCVNDVAPADRDIAMVFQDYALYPHMTVEENLSFGLKMRKTPKEEIQKRVQEAAVSLKIDHLLDRKPAALSGGQRQRVAIGRAIVRNPTLFLFDEPLSNLDAKLRAQTRIELASLHKRLKSTMVYVTHDQCEAMTLANRIVVLHKGRVQQYGTPLELYHSPANRFVASFIGNPSMNFLEGNLYHQEEGSVIFTPKDQPTLGLRFGKEVPLPKVTGSVVLGIRPESVKVLAATGRESQGQKDMELTVQFVEPHGHESQVVATWAGLQILVRTANPHRLAVIDKAQPGDKLWATLDHQALHWFAPTEEGDRLTVS